LNWRRFGAECPECEEAVVQVLKDFSEKPASFSFQDIPARLVVPVSSEKQDLVEGFLAAQKKWNLTLRDFGLKYGVDQGNLRQWLRMPTNVCERCMEVVREFLVQDRGDQT
jgi:hypothetical protein